MDAMGDPASRRLELDVELGAEPIKGRIRDPAGAEASFDGWLELLTALERLRAPDPRDAER